MEVSNITGKKFLNNFKTVLLSCINSIRNLKQYEELFSNYNQEDIEAEVSRIYMVGDYICIPNDSLFLRLIQYGGYKIKAPGLLSRTCRLLGGEML